MGTPSFAVPSLDALVAHHDVLAVVTRPDAVTGRGSSLRPSAVKVRSLELGIPVIEPLSLAGPCTETLRRFAADVICVAAFGMLLPAETLSAAPAGCINVHASLLPHHRGAAPIARAILQGDPITGVSIMRMEEGLDTGPFALQRTLPVGEVYAEELEASLATLGAEALIEALAAVADGSVVWTEQDPADATYAAKLTKDDVALTPELSVSEAYARVRASSRRAPARACLGEGEVTVVRAHPDPGTTGAGTVCAIGGLPRIGFADGSLVLDVLRPAGRSDVTGAEWVRGARLGADVCWRCTR